MHLQPTAAAARTASLTGSTSSSARSRTTCPKNPHSASASARSEHEFPA
jgi:hypothetical protein